MMVTSTKKIQSAAAIGATGALTATWRIDHNPLPHCFPGSGDAAQSAWSILTEWILALPFFRHKVAHSRCNLQSIQKVRFALEKLDFVVIRPFLQGHIYCLQLAACKSVVDGCARLRWLVCVFGDFLVSGPLSFQNSFKKWKKNIKIIQNRTFFGFGASMQVLDQKRVEAELRRAELSWNWKELKNILQSPRPKSGGSALNCPHSPKMGSRWLQDGPTQPQDGLYNIVQDGHTMT